MLSRKEFSLAAMVQVKQAVSFVSGDVAESLRIAQRNEPLAPCLFIAFREIGMRVVVNTRLPTQPDN